MGRSRPSAEPLEGRTLLTGALSEFAGPYAFADSVAAGKDGDLYVANAGYLGDGSVTKLAPDGTPLANIPLPTKGGGGAGGIVAGSDGSIWVQEQGKLARIAPDGTVAEFAVRPSNVIGAGSPLAAGPDGSIWFINDGTTDTSYSSAGCTSTVVTPPSVGRIAADGTQTYYPVADGTPTSLTVGPDGVAAFVDLKADGSTAIDRLTAAGALSGTVLPASLTYPTSLTTGPDGALWFLDINYDSLANFSRINLDPPVVGRLDPSGAVSTFAFTPQPTPPLVPAGLPSGLVSAPDGNLYFLDVNAVDKVTTAGVVTSTIVPTGPDRAGDVIGPDGNLWIALDDVATAKAGIARYAIGATTPGQSAPPSIAPTPAVSPTPAIAPTPVIASTPAIAPTPGPSATKKIAATHPAATAKVHHAAAHPKARVASHHRTSATARHAARGR